MTLHELERLIRRIEEALERPSAAGGLQNLAADYTAIGRAAVTRLGQCAAMLNAGEEHQALQLAETQPALLDLMTLLSFRGSPSWRALCRSENLPTPEAFDVKAVRRLNELYAKGIDTDHALYRDYRRAVMLNDDANALGILRLIVRLNPNDQNARSEFERLENKQRSDKARELERLMMVGGDTETIAQVVEDLEAAKIAVEPVLWDRAQEVRAKVLMREVREAQKVGDLREVQQGIGTLQRLRHLLGSEEREALDGLDRWTVAEGERHKQEAGRRAALEHLASVTQRLAQQQLDRKRSLTELRASSATLENAWRQVERLRIQIRPDLVAQAQKTRDALNAEITHSVRASRRMAFAVVAAVVLICAVAAWMAYSRQSARSAAARIHSAIAERRVSDVETTLANATNMLASPALAEARDLAGKFLSRERALDAASKQALAFLDASARGNFTNDSPEKIAAAFESARNANSALAPEFRGSANVELSKREASWNEFVERERAARASKLVAMLTPLEASTEAELRFTLPPERVIQSAAHLRRELEPAQKLAESPVIKPKQEALFRLETLQARIEKFSRDATNWFEAHKALAGATNWQGYNAGLQQLISSGFTPGAQREAAGALAALNLSSKSVLGPLLLPNGPQSALLEPPYLPRTPRSALPAEKEIQRRLGEDPNIHGVSQLEIEVKALPAEDPRRRRTIFLRGELQQRVTRKAGQIYDPVESPGALNFVQKEMGSLDFTVEGPKSTAEVDLYERTGLSRLVDANTGNYTVSLLEVLDEINGDRKANPLFRAYLFTQVCEMIEAQPSQWGSIWSPALAHDRQELVRLGVAQIHSGDWMIPVQIAHRAQQLREFFERAAQHSYARESSFFKRLLPRAMEVGTRVVGNVSAAGEAVLNQAELSTPVWGLTAIGKSPEIILNSKTAKRAILFSPLFIFGGNAAEMVDETLHSLSYSPSSVGLPESLPPILRTTQ